VTTGGRERAILFASRVDIQLTAFDAAPPKVTGVVLERMASRWRTPVEVNRDQRENCQKLRPDVRISAAQSEGRLRRLVDVGGSLVAVEDGCAWQTSEGGWTYV